MTKQKTIKILSLVFCLVLVAAMALGVVGCGGSSKGVVSGAVQTAEKSFTLIIENQEGEKETKNLVSDEKYVGDALLKQKLIAGEEGQYGLYIKTVNGITLDFEKDGLYWAFYIDGEYATAGIDQTPIVDGAEYTLKAQK